MAEGSIYVGVLLVELATPWVQSLKEKRSVVMPITERLKARFPVSVARLSGLDSHKGEVIGVTALSSDGVWLEGLLGRVLLYIEGNDVQVVRSQLDVELWEFEP